MKGVIWLIEWRECKPFKGREWEAFETKAAAMQALHAGALYEGETLSLYRAVVDPEPVRTSIGLEPLAGAADV